MRRHTVSSNSSNGTSSLAEEMANIGGPTNLKRTLGMQSDRYSQYIGPTTDFEPSLIDLSPFDPHDESLLSRGTLRKVSDVDTFLLLPENITPGYEHQGDDSDDIEALVAPHGPELVDLYFRIIHPNLPILQKNVFYEKYVRTHREFAPPLLAAVYILAINWWDHSEVLANHPRPNVKELERLARASLSDCMYRPKLSTIQAGLLLSQCPGGDQWAPTAQLIAIGQELGLHLDCTNWKIPLWERGLRKRLAWALYMQDKWGALVHGRPSHIFPANWAVRPLTEHDFPDVEYDEDNDEEVAEYERGCLLFGQMIALSQILAEVLETFYTLSAMDQVARAGSMGTRLILELAKPVQLKLKEWFAALPPCLKMDSSNFPPSNRLSSTGFLHLAYFATEITLHRRIIRSLAASPPPSTPTSPTGPGSPQIEPFVVHICRSAAKTRLISAMDFVNRLTPSHLRAFWYFASKTNFALIGTFGSLLWATAPGQEEAEFYRMRLKEYRWTLGVSARVGVGAGAGGDGRGVKGLTEFALGMLDTSTGLLKALPEKPVISRRGSGVPLQASRSAQDVRSFASGGGTERSGRGPGGFNFSGTSLASLADVASASGTGAGGDVSRSESQSGLVSPSTSTSSERGGAGEGFEAFLAGRPPVMGMHGR